MTENLNSATDKPRKPTLIRAAVWAVSGILTVSLITASVTIYQLNRIRVLSHQAKTVTLPEALRINQRAVEAVSLFTTYHRLQHTDDHVDDHSDGSAGKTHASHAEILQELAVQANSLQRLVPADESAKLDEVLLLANRVSDLRLSTSRKQAIIRNKLIQARGIADKVAGIVVKFATQSDHHIEKSLRDMDMGLKQTDKAKKFITGHSVLSKQIKDMSDLRASGQTAVQFLYEALQILMLVESADSENEIKKGRQTFLIKSSEVATKLDTLASSKKDNKLLALVSLISEFVGFDDIFTQRLEILNIRESERQLSQAITEDLSFIAARLTRDADKTSVKGVEKISETSDIAIGITIIGIGVTAACFVFVLLLGRHNLTIPLRNAAEALENLGQGRPTPILPPMKLLELEQIRTSIGDFNESVQSALKSNMQLEEKIDELRESEKAAKHSREQTTDAIESIADAFVLFDRNRNFVLCNSRFRDFYPETSTLLDSGCSFEDIERRNLSTSRIIHSDNDIEAWIRVRLDSFVALRGTEEIELKGGRWISISDYRTQDGGSVSIHSDITARRTAEVSAKRRNELVQMLRDIAIEVNEAASVEDAMRNCLGKVCSASEFCIGHAYILSESTKPELAPTRLWHLDSENEFPEFVEATENKPFGLGIGLPGRVWASGKPHWIEDVRLDKNFPRSSAAQKNGLVSACAFPVMERDKTVAVLEFFTQKKLKQDNVLLDAFTSLSNILGRVTERKRTMGTLHRLQQAIEQSPSMIIITNNEGSIEYVNPEFTIKTGYRPEQILGQTPGILKSEETPASVHEHLWATIKSGKDWRGELQNKTKSGGTYWSSLAISPIRNDSGEITHFLGISEDISERKTAEQHIKHLAHFDNLTDLPNRAMFYSDSQRILAAGKRNDTCVALLMLDLDDFKDVNDSLGHAAGDQLLKEVGDRLQQCMRDYDVVARLGGDEFATILPEIDDPDAAADTAKRLIEVIREPYNIENTDLYINASIGVAIYPQDGTDIETLLRHADLAMYRAKNRGRGTFNFFHESMDNEVQARKDIEADLRVAMSENELDLVYQPQVDTQSKRIIGVEALVRWHHPVRGTVPPFEFIPIAERSGLIVPIGEWVLRKACTQAMKWIAKGYSEFSMSVNLSPIQFKHHELLSSIERVLEDTGIPPNLLTLEITESVVVQETDDNVRLLSQLQDRGIMIALDDFGTGYSSLSYLTQLPLNKIKIDRSFIVGMMQSETQRSVVRTIVELGNALGKSITVEGVEDSAQYEYLKSIKVDEIQGYYFSKPLRPDELEELIKPKN